MGPGRGLYRVETCLQINGNEVTEWAIRGDMIHHVGVGDLWVIDRAMQRIMAEDR
jgi:sialate O-acetylesterase